MKVKFTLTNSTTCDMRLLPSSTPSQLRHLLSSLIRSHNSQVPVEWFESTPLMKNISFFRRFLRLGR